MPSVKNLQQLIGNTPLLKLTHFDTGSCELFIKCENFNLTGSIKDRIAFAMIEDAEQRNLIKPGDTLIEASSGNAGLAMANVALLKGYKMIIVIPDKMSQEKIDQLKAMNAEVIVTRSDVNKGDPEYYQDVALRISNERNAYYMRQFENPANYLEHEKTTAPEIWHDMQENVDAIVMGVGTGGHLTGISRYFAKVSPQTEMILADPIGSVLADMAEKKKVAPAEFDQWLVEGIGEDFVPQTCDLSRVKKAYRISDAEAFKTARQLLKKEAIYAGTSTGVALAAAIKYCQEQKQPKRVVTFAYDSGNRYLSKMYNEAWLKAKGIYNLVISDAR